MTLLAALTRATAAEPATRAYLKTVTGKSDRMTRRDIQGLRLQGHRIISGSSFGIYGYWIAKDEREYRAYRAQETARIRSESEAIRAMDGIVDGQLEMEV